MELWGPLWFQNSLETARSVACYSKRGTLHGLREPARTLFEVCNFASLLTGAFLAHPSSARLHDLSERRGAWEHARLEYMQAIMLSQTITNAQVEVPSGARIKQACEAVKRSRNLQERLEDGSLNMYLTPDLEDLPLREHPHRISDDCAQMPDANLPQGCAKSVGCWITPMIRGD